ncbi:MAG: TIGR02300 family protein [Rhodospirillales bacterium]
MRNRFVAGDRAASAQRPGRLRNQWLHRRGLLARSGEIAQCRGHDHTFDFDTAPSNWQLLATRVEERRVALAKPEWGLKRTCFSCGARFYDLRREPVVCPVCSAVHDPARQPRPKRSGGAARDEPAVAPTPVRGREAEIPDDQAVETDADELDEAADAGDEGDLDDLGSEENEMIEDASELGEDDDDIGEVMEHIDDEIVDKA